LVVCPYKTDLSVSKVGFVGFVGDGGFGDHGINYSKELDTGRDHNRQHDGFHEIFGRNYFVL